MAQSFCQDRVAHTADKLPLFEFVDGDREPIASAAQRADGYGFQGRQPIAATMQKVADKYGSLPKPNVERAMGLAGLERQLQSLAGGIKDEKVRADSIY